MRTAALVFLWIGDLLMIGIYKILFHVAQGPYWIHKEISKVIRNTADRLIQDYPGNNR